MEITIKHHALDQCQILANGRRVAYLGYWKDAPLNWLRKEGIGFALTVEEKLSISRHVRQAMEKVIQQREGRLMDMAASGLDSTDPNAFQMEEITQQVETGEAVEPPQPAEDSKEIEDADTQQEPDPASQGQADSESLGS